MKLTEVLYEFYSRTVATTKGKIIGTLQEFLLTGKCMKLSHLLRRKVAVDELKRTTCKRCRKYVKASSESTNKNRPNTKTNNNIINLSQIDIPKEQMKILRYGLKFVPTPRKFNRFALYHNIKYMADNIFRDTTKKSAIRNLKSEFLSSASIQKYTALLRMQGQCKILIWDWSEHCNHGVETMK
ncbi:hypothetical protein GJ496_012052 [Pomphorhynchus laevis]|nr:hypothetical protein GJ496_012052 [Pomphorhynchus laevis]